MTPQQIDAMKLALGQLQAGFVGNAMQILREALAEHAMQKVQRLGQEIEATKRKWVDLTDDEIDRVTDAQWGKNVNKPIYAAHRAYARAVEAASKEKNT